MMRVDQARRLLEEVERRTVWVMGPPPLAWRGQLFHRLLTRGLDEALEVHMRYSHWLGYALPEAWCQSVYELEAEMRGAGDTQSEGRTSPGAHYDGGADEGFEGGVGDS